MLQERERADEILPFIEEVLHAHDPGLTKKQILELVIKRLRDGMDKGFVNLKYAELTKNYPFQPTWPGLFLRFPGMDSPGFFFPSLPSN